jgi:septum formation protein
VRFEIRVPGVEEIEHGEPGEVAIANAQRKARAVADGRSRVIACDTLVALGGRIFGKPADAAEARATLTALSGTTHEVLGGLWLVDGELQQGGVARTRVTFREITPELLDWFIARGEWEGRSGGYAIQGGAAAFATQIDGDFENIVGLPLSILLELWPRFLLENA